MNIETGICLRDVYYQYKNQAENKDQYILNNISLEINQGEYVAIVGKTGSGKSTLLQQLNGLEKPIHGSCYYKGTDIHQKGYSMREHRMKVALCFQYPEHQLFAETVLKDICFGPENQGLSEEQAIQKAKAAMQMLGLEEGMEEISPFLMSGGQQRKVALAGLLAMEPEVLILDEPVAGLDYQSKKRLFQILKELNEKKKMTIILVSHDMEDVASNAKRVVVLKDGSVFADGNVREILTNAKLMEEAGLAVPKATKFFLKLQEKNNAGKSADHVEKEKIPMTPQELATYIAGERL